MDSMELGAVGNVEHAAETDRAAAANLKNQQEAAQLKRKSELLEKKLAVLKKLDSPDTELRAEMRALQQEIDNIQQQIFLLQQPESIQPDVQELNVSSVHTPNPESHNLDTRV
ncbi:MAG: hypothetical protein LKF71_06700 [Oscillospiraceae bacterium]|jgi:carbonic anhydrase|nr:hypothetical protein [Oscillospiraceae bacterium]